MDERINKIPASRRGPTKRMIEKLNQCLQKQSAEGNIIPLLAEEMKSSLSGLYKRGFITTKMQMINGKRQLCIYITESGKSFLLNVNEKTNSRGQRT